MSLIYDALRAPPADQHRAPVYGSVCAERAPGVRRKRWAWGVVSVGAGLVVVGALALFGQSGRAPARADGAASLAPAAALAPAAPAATVIAPSAQARIVEPASVAAALVTAPRARVAQPVAEPALAAPTPATATRAPAAPAASAAPPAPAVARPVVAAASRPAPASATAQADRAQAAEPARTDFGNSLRRFNSLVARAEFEPAAQLLEELRVQGLSQLAQSRMAGYLALQANRLEQARRSYEQVLAQFPYDREAVLNLALIDLREGFLTEAEQRLRAFTELKPDDAQVRALLAQVRAQGRR